MATNTKGGFKMMEILSCLTVLGLKNIIRKIEMNEKIFSNEKTKTFGDLKSANSQRSFTGAVHLHTNVLTIVYHL